MARRRNPPPGSTARINAVFEALKQDDLYVLAECRPFLRELRSIAPAGTAKQLGDLLHKVTEQLEGRHFYGDPDGEAAIRWMDRALTTRLRRQCAERGLDYEGLTEAEREELIQTIVEEDESAGPSVR